MLPIKPTVEVHSTDFAAAMKLFERLHTGLSCTSTSPKAQELKARYEARQAESKNADPNLKVEHV